MKAVNTLFGLLLFGLLAMPHAYASDKTEQINSILEQSGFDKLLQYVPDFAQRTLKQSSGALEPEMSSTLSGIFQQAFNVNLVQRDINAMLNSHYNSEYATTYIKLLQSPLHTRMAALERTTNNPANRNDIANFNAAQQTSPAPQTRTALIERLDKANRTTEFSIDMQSAFFKAIFIAIAPAMDTDMRLGDGELEKMVNEVRVSLEASLRNNTQLSYLYAFRDINDVDLEQYIELCESEEYRWGIQLLGNALISAINQAAERAALTMSQNIH